MTTINDKTLGQMAVECPHYIPVFESRGLDYYQRGHRTLYEACQEAGLDEGEIREELKVLKVLPFQENIDANSSLSDIVRLIVGRHHSYVRGQLERMEDLIEGMGGNEGFDTHAAILKRHFLILDEALRRHLLEEEIEVFPRLLWFERNGMGAGVEERRINFLDSIRHILLDHHFMDHDFMELKKLVYHFRNLTHGSEVLEGFAKALEGLDKDNHRHIHLENNILLRKAASLGILKNVG